MSVSITTNPGGRAAYINTMASAAQAEEEEESSVPANPQDTVSISPEAREAMTKQAADSTDAAGEVGEVSEEQATAITTFPSFAAEFEKVTERYTEAVRAHYAQAHKENLTYDDPSTHIWNKYKNPESPDFRADLSEDERAWAYDHEQDMLRGGKHFQLGNPFVFDDPPTLSTAVMEANQACREDMDETIQYLFQKNGIEVSEPFRLTVDSDYTIHVTGLEDRELAQSIEQALNTGDNGKNLYRHLKITSPDGEELGVNYADGHLEALDTRQELGEEALTEAKIQAGAPGFHYSDTYNPYQGPLGVLIPHGYESSPADLERICSIARLGGPQLFTRDQVGEFYRPSLELITKYPGIDNVNTVARDIFHESYLQQTADIEKTIKDYYAAAHRENSSYPFEEGIQHIKDKYRNQDSPIFRFDLPPVQRDMYYRQEMALLTNSLLTLRDPYALASTGGVLTAEAMHDKAMQAVLEKLDAMVKNAEKE